MRRNDRNNGALACECVNEIRNERKKKNAESSSEMRFFDAFRVVCGIFISSK